MKKILVSIFVVSAFLLLSHPTQAAEPTTTISPSPEASAPTAVQIYHPRLLPTSPFYFLKHLKEQLELALTFSPEKKAEKEVEFATRRLAEANVVAAKHPELAQKLMDRYQKWLAKARERAQKLPPEKRMHIMEGMNRQIERHLWVWRHIEDKLPPQAKERVQRALQVGIEHHRQAIQRIQKHIQRLPSEVRKKLERRQKKMEEELRILENTASHSDQLKIKDLRRLRRVLPKPRRHLPQRRQRHPSQVHITPRQRAAPTSSPLTAPQSSHHQLSTSPETGETNHH